MSVFTDSPHLLKGGIVLIDPQVPVPQRIIVLQYNPDTLSRTLQVQSIGAEGSADRSEALRIKAPPVESIKLEAEIDATDQLESPEENPSVLEYGIHAQLAALETIIYPQSSQLEANNRLAQSGTLEITPMQAPLTLFIWGKSRILPVRITEFSVTEEAFDSNLNPIRAKVSLGMRVLNVNDLGFDHPGGGMYMSYHKAKEQLANMNKNGSLNRLGIGGF